MQRFYILRHIFYLSLPIKKLIKYSDKKYCYIQVVLHYCW